QDLVGHTGIMRIYTIGHGAREIDEFLETLAAGSVELLADVRSFPASRRHPHFGKDAIAATLTDCDVEYVWMPALGGRRKSSKSPSPNPSSQVDAFRAYADYMDSTEFKRGIDDLLARAEEKTTAIMCAETHWSQCHRRLISDKLWALGVEVVHLIT